MTFEIVRGEAVIKKSVMVNRRSISGGPQIFPNGPQSKLHAHQSSRRTGVLILRPINRIFPTGDTDRLFNSSKQSNTIKL